MVFVFPVWWWSMPAMLKGWIDRVWNNGWAYGARKLPHRRALLIGTLAVAACYLAMNVACLAALPLGIAHAAGPFDGQWKGSWSGISTIGPQPYPCQQYSGNVDMTITDGRVTGATTGFVHDTIEGMVAENGKFTGKMGPYAMSGSFSAKRFSARFTTAKCAMAVSAKPAS
jgi:hypothetical protein